MNGFKNSVTQSLRNGVSSVKATAATVGTGLALLAGSAAAQTSGIDTASIVTEIGAAKAAGMLVLGAMILAGLGFKAWKLLKRA